MCGLLLSLRLLPRPLVVVAWDTDGYDRQLRILLFVSVSQATMALQFGTSSVAMDLLAGCV